MNPQVKSIDETAAMKVGLGIHIRVDDDKGTSINEIENGNVLFADDNSNYAVPFVIFKQSIESLSNDQRTATVTRHDDVFGEYAAVEYKSEWWYVEDFEGLIEGFSEYRL